MASFGDNILRLLKKTAKKNDQQNDAVRNIPAPNQTGEESPASSSSQDQAGSECEPALDSLLRNKECLQGNFNNAAPPTESKWQRQGVFDRSNIIYDKGEVSAIAEPEEHSISFNRAASVSHSLAGEDDGELPSIEDQLAASQFISKLFASEIKAEKKLEEQAEKIKSVENWSEKPSEMLTAGRASNPTEESYKQVASCETTSPTTLTWLATQPSAEIRAAVAANHHTPADALRKLAVDADFNVRLAVAANKRSGDDVLKQLTHDENRLVSGEAFSALTLREKAHMQSNNSGFNKFVPPRVNPVQTKVPIIGSAPGSKTPTGVNLPKYTPANSLTGTHALLAQPQIAQPIAKVAPTAPATPAIVAGIPVPTDLPVHLAKDSSPSVSAKMLTPRSLPKPNIISPPPSGLPINVLPSTPALSPAPISSSAPVSSPTPITSSATPRPESAAAEAATPDGHNLLNNHRFKTTSNHLVASYTDLDAISIEIDNRSPGAWLSLNSEGAVKAYTKQKDTVKDVKINLASPNSDGSKHNSPVVNITPNATASETIVFLKLVAGRVSTPPGRLVELAAHANEEVRSAVAENANLPPDAFSLLSKDAVSTVKLRLIDNCHCPTEVLGTLQNDSDPYVAFEARNALKRLGAGLLKEREQNQFRPHGHNNTII